MCGIKLHNELDTMWFLVNLICGIVAVDGKYNLMLYIILGRFFYGKITDCDDIIYVEKVVFKYVLMLYGKT